MTKSDLISRADAIALLTEIVFDEPPYFDSETLCRLYAEEQINTLPSAEIAETESIAIRSRTLMPTKDFKEWAKRIREVNPDAIVIPCDAEVVSAETEWIPCSERLPKAEDMYQPPEQRYLCQLEAHGMRKFCVLSRLKGAAPPFWDWYGIAVYDSEVIAWMPLPKPYREDGEQE